MAWQAIDDRKVGWQVGRCRDDPVALVKIAAKLPDIAIEIDVVEDQYGIARCCECESALRERRFAAAGRAVRALPEPVRRDQV